MTIDRVFDFLFGWVLENPPWYLRLVAIVYVPVGVVVACSLIPLWLLIDAVRYVVKGNT